MRRAVVVVLGVLVVVGLWVREVEVRDVNSGTAVTRVAGRLEVLGGSASTPGSESTSTPTRVNVSDLTPSPTSTATLSPVYVPRSIPRLTSTPTLVPVYIQKPTPAPTIDSHFMMLLDEIGEGLGH